MWRFLAKGAVSALLIWFLLRNRDLGVLCHQMLAVESGILVLAASLLWILAVPWALRWSTILRTMGHPIRFRVTFPLVLIGLFFNLTLPSAIGGDAVRMWMVHRAGLPGAAAVTSVIIDRLVALLALLVLVFLSLPAFFSLISDRVARAGVLLLLGGGFVSFAAIMLLDRLPLTLSRFRILRELAQLSADLRRILLIPRTAARTLLLSLVNQGGLVAVVALLAQGLGAPVGWLHCLVIVPLAILVTVLPVSIAGWGVREGAFVVGFGFVGVLAADALAISVLFGLLNTLVSLPGGLVWFASGKRHRGMGPNKNGHSSGRRPGASGE